MKNTISQLTKRTLTILVGYSGSGKSTYARSLLQTRPNTICISRDKIRIFILIQAHFDFSKTNID